MQVSVNTVKVHKQRAKMKLRAELKDLYPMIALLMI
jgi:DNA-binding CsgD family transcriptional regulator